MLPLQQKHASILCSNAVSVLRLFYSEKFQTTTLYRQKENLGVHNSFGQHVYDLKKRVGKNIVLAYAIQDLLISTVVLIIVNAVCQKQSCRRYAQSNHAKTSNLLLLTHFTALVPKRPHRFFTSRSSKFSVHHGGVTTRFQTCRWQHTKL